MKDFLYEGREEGRSFLVFLGHNKALVIFTLLLSVLSVGMLLLNCQDILTDSELYIMSPEGMMDTYNRVGRFGLTLTKKLFFTNGYTPFLFILYTMITMCIVCLVFDFVVCRIVSRKNKLSKSGRFFWFCVIFNSVYMTSPVLPHQFYFIYQAFEVSAAFLFCILAALGAFLFVYEGKSKLWGAYSIGFMVWAFATYQVLVPYYICLNAILFFLYYLYDRKEQKKTLLLAGVQLIGLFLTGLAVYFLVYKGIALWKYKGAGQGQLTDTYVEWGRQGLRQCLTNIKGDFHRVFFQDSPAFHRLTLPIVSLFFITSLFFGWRTKKKGFYLFAASGAGVILSAFLMTLLMGNYLILRAQLVYPLMFAFCCAALAAFPYKNRVWMWIVVFVMFFTSMGQLKTANRFYTAMHLTAEEDKNIARQIYMETAKYRDPLKPEDTAMIFIGGRPSVELPTNKLSWDAVGMSFFYINYVDVQGTYRIYKFMNSLGLKTAEPHIEQYNYGRSLSLDMPCWPAEGSIRYEDGTIYVKLSDLEPLP